jgi:hypothetical protein
LHFITNRKSISIFYGGKGFCFAYPRTPPFPFDLIESGLGACGGIPAETIEIENGFYKIEVKIKNDLYSIRHFEPAIKDFDPLKNYGMRYWYDVSLFNEEKNL